MAAQLGVPKFGYGQCNTLEDTLQQLQMLDDALGNPTVPLDPDADTADVVYYDGSSFIDADGTVISGAAGVYTFSVPLSNDGADNISLLYDTETLGVNGSNELYVLSPGVAAEILGEATINNSGGYSEGSATVAFNNCTSIFGTVSATGTAHNTHNKAFRNAEEILVAKASGGDWYAIKIEVGFQYAQVNNSSNVEDIDSTFAFDDGVKLEGTVEVTGTAKNPCGLNWSDNEKHLQFLADDGQWVAIKQHDACVFFATADEAVAAGDASFDAVTLVDFMNQGPAVGSPFTVQNTLGFTIADGQQFIAARAANGDYDVLSIVPTKIVMFLCQPTANVTGGASFSADTISQVLGPAPSGTVTINNPLGFYVDADKNVLAIEDYNGDYQAVSVQDYAPAWLRAQSGYNGANNQVFHHDAGTFKWGDYGSCP